MDVTIRWLIRRDQHEVCAIEDASYQNPWTHEEFLRCLRRRDCVGMVAEDRNGLVVGYMLYLLKRGSLHVLNLTVDPDCRRQRVGTVLVEKLINKLSQQRRTRLTFEVRETNLPGQLFLRSLGFRVVDQSGRYADTDEACYMMAYELGRQVPDPARWAVGNRISEYLA